MVISVDEVFHKQIGALQDTGQSMVPSTRNKHANYQQLVTASVTAINTKTTWCVPEQRNIEHSTTGVLLR